MKIKHVEPYISNEKPFENCKLGREKYADVLTEIVKLHPSGFVLALNNQWGTGKTTFLKMWKAKLRNQGLTTIYFNAWENDFNSDPLAAILAELKFASKDKGEKGFQNLLKIGSVLAKGALPAVLKTVAKKYMGEEYTEAVSDTTKELTEILSTEVDDYIKKQEGLKEFKAFLAEYISTEIEKKPLVFLVDELDRCRPDYSVKFLEYLKHFFSVEGIVFVLAIDKEQIGHAVKGVYGSNGINSEEYLRRFIDLEYSIPKPDTKEFCKYLFEYFEFQQFFRSNERLKLPAFKNDSDDFINLAALMFEKNNITLRQQEKIFAHARMGLLLFGSNNYVFPDLYIVLLFLKNTQPSIYKQITNKAIDINQLLSQIGQRYFSIYNHKDSKTFNRFAALLALFYFNSLKVRDENLIFQFENPGHDEVKPDTPIRLRTYTDQPSFEYYFREYYKDYNLGRVSLDFLLDKINLLEALK